MPRLMARLGSVARRVWLNGGLYRDDAGNRAVLLMKMPETASVDANPPTVEVSQLVVC